MKRSPSYGQRLIALVKHRSNVRNYLSEAWTRAAAVASGVALVGLLLVVGAARLHAGFLKPVAQDLAAAIFTSGLLGLLYEMLLRQSLVSEILEKVGLRDRLARAGLKDVSTDQLDWTSFFAGRTTLALLPLDPDVWLKQAWPRLIEVARTRKLTVNLYLPQTSGVDLAPLAARLGTHSNSLRLSVTNLQSSVKRTWQSPNQQLVSGSALIIHTYKVVPFQATFRADDIALVVLPGAPNAEFTQADVTLTFDLAGGSPHRGWIREQFDGLGAVALPTVLTP